MLIINLGLCGEGFIIKIMSFYVRENCLKLGGYGFGFPSRHSRFK